MGWFIGISGKNSSLKKRLKSLTKEVLFSVDDDKLFLEAGGLQSTTHFKKKEEAQSGWVASGIGISNKAIPNYLDKDSWDKAISSGRQKLHTLNGHFAVAAWKNGSLDLVTDQLGMRNIFIHQGDDFVLFSTRLDWMLELVPSSSINWKKFGSRWLTVNQFSAGSFITGLDRLSQGGHAKIEEGKVTITHKRWHFTPKTSSPKQVQETLLQFTSISLHDNQPLSLGLSGGLDSRTLFALLLSSPHKNWMLHTFAEQNHPDLEVAIKLNQPFRKEHHILSIPKIPTEQIIEELSAFIIQNQLTSVPASLETFHCYDQIQNLNLSVVDGGFGEIARRRFLVSLLLRGKQSLLDKNIEGILPHLRLHRADIFTQECNLEMLAGLKEELSAEIEAMPDISEMDINTWLDLFSVRTRVPNGAGPEQARSDALIFNYMPFLQPQFIEQALNLPLKYRKNAALFRSIIRNTAPELTTNLLVKGSVSYPYWMKDISSAVWMKLKQKMGMYHHSKSEVDFLYRIEEYVQDIFHSESVQNYPAYDISKIRGLMESFYQNKNEEFAGELNWWLAFEVLRDKLRK